MSASLIEYGIDFPAFLAGFAHAADLPYLAGVATVDRFWSEAHIARDEPRLAARQVTRLSVKILGRSVLRPHASARWRWFPEQPNATLWQANRAPQGEMLNEYAWHGEGILLARPGSEVTHRKFDLPGVAFLDACAQGRPADKATLAALQADEKTDLAALMSSLLEAGAFTGIFVL